MSEHEQIHPVYLDTGSGIVTVISCWSDELNSYQLKVCGDDEALGFLYPDSSPESDENGQAYLLLQEADYQFKDLKEVRRWLRDLMMDWRDAGATPTTAPDPQPDLTKSEDTLSTAVFGTIADVRQEAHNKAVSDKEDSILELSPSAPSSETEIDENAETVVESSESETQTLSPEGIGHETDPVLDTSAETVQEEETNSFQGDSERYAQEISPAGVVPDSAEDAGSTDDWDGAEVTMIPSSRNESAEPASDDQWDGAEQTMIGSSAPASEGDWDGSEQTMVGGAGSGDWDGSEQTMVGQVSGDWDGAEQTVIGAPAGAEPRNESDKDRENSTSSAPTKTSTGTRTNPSFNDGWHLKGDPGPCTGEIWGDYEIGGKLGEGGMGTVYRGRQFSLRRRVAVKVLPPHLSNDPQMRERFELEAQSASVLNSPHVVQVFAAGTENGNAYYVMEFVEGRDLHDVVKEHVEKEEQLDPHLAADYVIQAGRGLIEAQKHDFVHRDIKPPNLMLTKKGTVKIADFGIVKVMGESSLTMTGTAIGTPAYCSPEQGGGTGCDGRSDIYSMGVVFYELLTLQKPFDGNTGNALIYQHTYTEPKLLTDVNPDCPASYQSVVLKCMQKNPDDRYQTAQELVDDLERVRLGTAPLAQVFGTGAEAMLKAKGLSRAKKWPMLVATAAVIAVLVGGIYWYQGAAERSQKIEVLREQLKYLNKSEAPKDGAEEYVMQLQELAGYNDTDVVRWREKIESLSTLTASLSRLDETTEPSSDVLSEAQGDYDEYVGLFGSEGESSKRWNRKISEAEVKIAGLRKQIGQDLRINDNELNVGIWDRVLPPLAILSHMAGEGDADVARWQGRYDTFKDRVAALREGLKPLDAEDLTLTEAQQVDQTRRLGELKIRVDERDIDVLRWQAVLQKQGNTLANMRETLSVFDSNVAQPFVSQMLMQELAPTLNGYENIVAEDDVKLKRWQKKYSDSKAIIAKHTKWMSERIDPIEGWLSLQLQLKARERFDVIRPLIDDENTEMEKWGYKISESERITASMRDRLRSVLSQEKMSKADVARARKTIDELVIIGGLEESRDIYENKLREQEHFHADLREQLQALNRVAPITEELQKTLSDFTRYVGSDDEEGKKWREKNANYQRLHSSLSILDQKIVFTKEHEQSLDALVKLVGYSDKDVIRWRDKVNRVHDLVKTLSVLDKSMPVPEAARDSLAELADLTGARDERYLRWLAKLNRVDELKEQLTALNGAYVLPAGSDVAMEELKQLVGETDEHFIKWQPVVTRLIGPSRPAWATHFGRDDKGVFAEVTIDDLAYRFRYVPAGTFLIGSPENQIGRGDDEHQVPITLTRGYWMAEQECTQTLWASFNYENPYPSKFYGSDRPVERVSWYETQIFLEAFNERVGLKAQQARLPSEAEWEYACRVGNETALFIDDQGENTDADQVAWFYTNANERTQSVKGRVCNALGLYDMHGNVWEWCQDNFGAYPPAGATDPTGGAQEEFVVRGGSFYDYEENCRAANRLGIDGNLKTMYVGFRIVISLDNDAMEGMPAPIELAPPELETDEDDELPLAEEAEGEQDSIEDAPAEIPDEEVDQVAKEDEQVELSASPDAEEVP